MIVLPANGISLEFVKNTKLYHIRRISECANIKQPQSIEATQNNSKCVCIVRLCLIHVYVIKIKLD